MTSYGTPSDSDGYFLERYNRSGWFQFDNTQKQQLLNEATVLIDNLNFVGDKTVENQELEFPRSGDLVVPQNIENAAYEIAYALGVTGRDIELENLMLGDASISLGPGKTTIAYVDDGRAHNIPSVVAWRLLRPFLRDGDSANFYRVT